MDNFNNFFQQQIWGGGNKNLLQHAHQQPRSEISSSEKGAMIASLQSNSLVAPSKLAQAQPPHSTNRDITTLSIDNRLYLDGLRQQQARANSFTNGTLTISPAGGGSSRDNNNNGLNQSISFGSQKLLNRLDIDTIRSNINSHRSIGSCSGSGNSMVQHHQQGTILFNTLNGGALGTGSMMPGSSAESFSGPDLVDSTTPPPTAILMPPASSASLSSSTVSTNLGLNRNSQDANAEKIKTPNSIRGKPRDQEDDIFVVSR